ncbi:hypothetical protein WA026_000542 [Henosepilachna vigintioctopunctata]|uniref:C2H2-type domain-containing protein n=1 Tax=Henosepilachna vigintioctopunctata TaxID=420089 RepID=A0AAW1V5A0_9CUCU
MMNFSHFGSHFSATIPNIHQFAAKFSQENLVSNTVISPNQETNAGRYSSNGLTFAQHHPSVQQNALGASIKYPNNYVNHQSNIYTQVNVRNDKRENFEQQELTQEICAAVLQEEKNSSQKVKQEVLHDRLGSNLSQMQQSNSQSQSSTMSSTWQSLANTGSTMADYLSHLPANSLPLSLHHFLKYSAENLKKETSVHHMIQNHDTNLNLLQNNMITSNNLNNNVSNGILNNNVNNLPGNVVSNTLNTLTSITTNPFQSVTPVKKKKKKKIEKEKKPRPKPGEIRLTTALDGSTLYCCPECHMAYPEKELLEQHLLGHTLERRFVCDICGAGLKRKDHLTRHKQSHNPERPYVCTVCLKAFKRKEQLTLHFVIHSGEKRHICTECGKGFYRKDHLRKHTRSHIARRVKAELSQQGNISTLTQNHGISS